MVFDVDGVLTDGSLYYGAHGETLKRFHALDGHGLRLLLAAGLKVALMSARRSPIVDFRAAELGITLLQQGVRDKGAALAELRHHLAVSPQQVGYMGDDAIDLPAMQDAGFAASVPHATAYVRHAVHWVSTQHAGKGAVRECCDVLLAAQGRLADLLCSLPRGAHDAHP
jgi:3-deoxy-D-manno-octulosonate 8-phosphate phosphatase (KDO 8-P phosphatase)